MAFDDVMRKRTIENCLLLNVAFPPSFSCSLEQLDRVDTPNVSEAYAMTVAFRTLIALVNSIDSLVKSTVKTGEGTKVEGWIEPAEEVKTSDQTGVGTEAVENSDNDEGMYRHGFIAGGGL